MNSETEQIAKNIVSTRDPPEHIVDTRVERCSIG
jgi:hypothetical protein